MEVIDELYSNIVKYLDELFERFLKSHMDELNSNSNLSLQSGKKYILKQDIDESSYRMDVQAYTVLSHAAFEDFFENIALSLMKEAFEEWDSSRKVTDILLTQICYFLSYNERQERIMSLEIKTKGNKTDLTKVTQYLHHIDNLRHEAETFFTKQIKDNHGIALDYLLHVLIPVSINICQDVDMMDSLKKLKDSRGEMAHKRALTKIPNPIEIFNDVKNCLKLCEDIKDQSKNKYTKTQPPVVTDALKKEVKKFTKSVCKFKRPLRKSHKKKYH